MNSSSSTQAKQEKQAKPTEEPKKGFKWVQNLMSGVWVQIEENTPFCCDPSTETYWSL